MIYAIIKRACDVILSVLALIVFSPLMIVTSIIIYLSDPGPVLFCSSRVGKEGQTFTMYKFRSMYHNDSQSPLITLRNDERIFPFGRFMRKTKIDELPQLINIIKGEMSIVGWRPEDAGNRDRVFKNEYKRILSIKPGLTSPASLYDYTHGEKCENEEIYGNEFLDKKLKLELYYVDNRTLFYDALLIIRTIKTIGQVIIGKNDFPLPIELQWIQE